ncbi:MAG: hypothetical protein NTZ21_03770 [Actinobacteria bacterium]|nr:hypothetical protein [Actinomycetota bacterium]
MADLTTVAPAPSSTASAAVTTTDPEPSVVATTEAATTVPDTTVAAPATTAADDGLTGPMFSDALGVKVDSAPGVRTRGDTRQLLPEGLYVHIAWEPDPQDPSVFTVQPDDVAILEAYTNAARTFYAAAMTTRTTAGADFDRYFVDGGAKFDRAFQQAQAGGYVKVLGKGALLRPYVLGDNRTNTEAVVLDCAITHEEWSSGNTTGSEVPAVLGTVATLIQKGGVWIVDTVAEEPAACL